MKHRIKKLFSCIIIAYLIIMSSCGKTSGTVATIPFTRTAAYETTADGWVYAFIRHELKDPDADREGMIRYQFFGINLRYRYQEGRLEETVQASAAGEKKITYIPAVLIWGPGSEDEQKDADLIYNVILRQDRSPEELLSLDPEEYNFISLDKNVFFNLMQRALTEDAHPETTLLRNMDLPSYAMLQEPLFADGYKFQLGFVVCMGYIDEIYIDVLYENGTGALDYIQLSDLVDQGTATPEQEELFRKIQAVARSIRGTDQLLAGSEQYKSEQIAGVSLDRLYALLKNVDDHQHQQYALYPIVLEEGAADMAE